MYNIQCSARLNRLKIDRMPDGRRGKGKKMPLNHTLSIYILRHLICGRFSWRQTHDRGRRRHGWTGRERAGREGEFSRDENYILCRLEWSRCPSAMNVHALSHDRFNSGRSCWEKCSFRLSTLQCALPPPRIIDLHANLLQHFAYWRACARDWERCREKEWTKWKFFSSKSIDTEVKQSTFNDLTTDTEFKFLFQFTQRTVPFYGATAHRRNVDIKIY